jgi:alpha-beta hydrolase superfamily lysophospholipase
VLIGCFVGRPAIGQPADETAEPEIPEAEDVDVKTKDGVDLKATFYPGTAGKDSVPVILLHGLRGKRGEYADLAGKLQLLGHAVLVPDLRGHGDSTRQKRDDREVKLDAATLRPADLHLMVTQDMEALKRFLREKHNAKELNLAKLCVVGAELGAMVAINWAALDWSWPPVAAGKQGEDVKALVLLSPRWNLKGLAIKPAIDHEALKQKVSVLLFVGAGAPTLRQEADRLQTHFKRNRPEPADAKDRDFYFYSQDTSVQGTKLLGEQALGVDRRIAKFIELRLVKQSIPWTSRESLLK